MSKIPSMGVTYEKMASEAHSRGGQSQLG